MIFLNVLVVLMSTKKKLLQTYCLVQLERHLYLKPEKFSTLIPDLIALRKWIVSCGCHDVAMIIICQCAKLKLNILCIHTHKYLFYSIIFLPL